MFKKIVLLTFIIFTIKNSIFSDDDKLKVLEDRKNIIENKIWNIEDGKTLSSNENISDLRIQLENTKLEIIDLKKEYYVKLFSSLNIVIKYKSDESIKIVNSIYDNLLFYSTSEKISKIKDATSSENKNTIIYYSKNLTKDIFEIYDLVYTHNDSVVFNIILLKNDNITSNSVEIIIIEEDSDIWFIIWIFIIVFTTEY